MKGQTLEFGFRTRSEDASYKLRFARRLVTVGGREGGRTPMWKGLGCSSSILGMSIKDFGIT